MSILSRLIPILLVFFASTASKAQNLEWSNTRKLKGSAIFTSVIGENENGIYLLRYRNKFLSRNVVIERYRHQMGFALSKNIVLKRSRLLHIELTEGRILMLFTRFNRKEMLNEVVAQWMDEEAEYIGEPFVVIKANLSDYYDKGDFRIRISNNRKQILICHTEKSVAGNRILSAYVFDPKMTVSISRKWELDMAYDAFALHDLMVDDEANIFFLSNNHELVTKRNSEIPLDWKLFYYDAKADNLMDYKMSDSAYVLLGPRFSWDRFMNKVNISAFYGLDDDRQIKGLYNFELFPGSRQEPKITLHEFDERMKSEITGDRPNYGLDEIRNFKILEVIPNSDGGITVVAERSSFTFESDVTYVNGVPQTMSRNIYNYDDVLVMSMDSSLTLKWNHLINKSQSSLNDGGYYSSIIIANTRSKLYIIYNDRLRTNGDVIQYAYTSEGEVNHKILIRSDDDYVSVIPGEARQIAYNKLILPVSKDKKFSLLKLEYSN